jgi:hypothetical protein
LTCDAGTAELMIVLGKFGHARRLEEVCRPTR